MVKTTGKDEQKDKMTPEEVTAMVKDNISKETNALLDQLHCSLKQFAKEIGTTKQTVQLILGNNHKLKRNWYEAVEIKLKEIAEKNGAKLS
ncbi:hypothetical protein [Furfurilactobacillus entadae]|uniref:hypothetical protein n=1 Tax=Furfurilactobacillus entadae TaxID=2922307 RepID=UPI0035EE4EF4